MEQQQCTVLIVDDSPEDTELYRRFLQRDPKRSYHIEQATSGEEGLQTWLRVQPDVVVLDYRLPDLDGLAFLGQLQNLTQRLFLPVVMVTGQGNEAVAVQAMKAGAQDYLIKGQVTAEGLQRAIVGAIRTAKLHTQLQHHQERERLVTDLTRQIHQSLNLNDIRQMTVTQVRKVLQTDRVLILQILPEGKSRVISESVSNGWTSLLSKHYHDPCFQKTYLNFFCQGFITHHDDVNDSSVHPCYAKFLKQLQVQASLVVPILQQEQLWGLLIAQHCRSPRRWQPLEIDLLKDLTAQLGIALYQAELYQQLQTELTERKRTENILRQHQAQLQQQLAEIEAIYQTAPIGLNVLDTDLRFVRINQHLADMNGLSIEAHLGHTVRELLPDLADAAEQLLYPILQTGEPLLNIEIEGETPAQPGIKRTWVEHFLPLKDGDRVIGISTVCEEVTDRKRLETEREQILQRERVARESAEQANRLKDEFLAILSHELRTPLNPILGWAKLLQTRKLTPERTLDALASIERNAKLQTQLIDDLLDIARILRGKLSLKITPVNLCEVIEAAIDTIKVSAENKAISLQCMLPAIEPVSGDAARLQQVIWNLLSNAIKFTPKGGQIAIQLEQTDGQAQIIVRDTGKGICPKFLPHLFESFHQEDFSTTRQYGGLGLGLAIARQLVEAHGGTITATSPGEGLGATFTIKLPVLINTMPQTDPSIPDAGPSLDLTGLRVLAVDDEPDIRTLLTVMLSHYGADVMTVASAAELLTNLSSFKPDVLVCDIGMPDMDGYELIQHIRALSAAKGGKTAAIALTAYASSDDQQRALANGYQRHLAKPIEPEQLIQEILQVNSLQQLMASDSTL